MNILIELVGLYLKRMITFINRELFLVVYVYPRLLVKVGLMIFLDKFTCEIVCIIYTRIVSRMDSGLGLEKRENA